MSPYSKGAKIMLSAVTAFGLIPPLGLVGLRLSRTQVARTIAGHFGAEVWVLTAVMALADVVMLVWLRRVARENGGLLWMVQYRPPPKRTNLPAVRKPPPAPPVVNQLHVKIPESWTPQDAREFVRGRGAE